MARNKQPLRLRTILFLSLLFLALTYLFLAIGVTAFQGTFIDFVEKLFFPLAILGLGVSSWMLFKGIQPLENMLEKIQKFADGDYSITFATDKGAKEVQDVSRALDDIGTAINKSLQVAKANEENQKQFVSDVSHELKTPLTALRGTAETMLEDPEMPLEDREYFLQTMVSECDRLTRLANDLLTLQRIEDGTFIQVKERMNFSPAIDEVLKLLAPLFEDREVNVVVEGSAPDFEGNRDSILQVIVNLLENASRFSNKGDTITIKLADVNGRAVMSISDEGPGFGDVDPAMLFNRFYLGDSSRRRRTKTGGTGLGLSIVKSIVLSHGGTVEAFNLPDKGACFVVALPSCDEEIHATLPLNPGFEGAPKSPSR